MPITTQAGARWFWAHLNAPQMTDAQWDAYIEAMRAFFRRLEAPGVSLQVIANNAAPTPLQRERLGEMLKHETRVPGYRGNAMVLRSPEARGAVTAIGWASRKPYPERFFESIDAAFDWLRGQLDDPAVVDEMAARYQTWRADLNSRS